MDPSLLKNCKITRMLNGVAVGTSTQTPSAPVDMSGFDGVLFILAMGAITDGTPGIKARQGQASNMSDGADLAGSLTSVSTANKCAVLDVYRPQERYVDCPVVRGGSTGSVIDGVIAIQYHGRKSPISQSSSIDASKVLASPAEGTA